MEVLNISMDDDECDTSREAWDNWSEETECSNSSKREWSQKLENEEICEKIKKLVNEDLKDTKRPQVEYWRETNSSTELQLEDFPFFLTDVNDSISCVKNGTIFAGYEGNNGKTVSMHSVIR